MDDMSSGSSTRGRMGVGVGGERRIIGLGCWEAEQRV